jgi:cytochrome c-type biogenesis protein CcmE
MADNRHHATFVLEGGQDTRLQVICAAVLPDNLAENMDVVVEGRLEVRGVLRGDKVLTRCASKYQPGETSDSWQGAAAGQRAK